MQYNAVAENASIARKDFIAFCSLFSDGLHHINAVLAADPDGTSTLCEAMLADPAWPQPLGLFNLEHEIMALQSPAHEPLKKLQSKSFPRPFSMRTQQCHDNTIGCDSRFCSNLTLAKAGLPGSWVNNTPFRYKSRQPEVLWPPTRHPTKSLPETGSAHSMFGAPLRAWRQPQ